MQMFTKEKIISVILEEASSLEIDEMANIESELFPVVTKNLDPPKIFKKSDFNLTPEQVKERFGQNTLLDAVGLLSLDPQIKTQSWRARDTTHNSAIEDELIPDVAVCYIERRHKFNPEYKFYQFFNYSYLPEKTTTDGQRVRTKFPMFIWTINDEPIALFRNLRRNKFFSTRYESKEEPQYTSETFAKKYIHFEKINELFNRDEIRRKLYSCGLPPIMGFAKYGQPTTHKINDAKYTAPDYDFLLSGVWPSENVQSAMELILNYRKANFLGKELPEMPPPTHMPRSDKFRQVYGGGHWKAGQKIASKENAKQTDKLRLWMKAIAGGELSFYIGSYLNIIGTIRDNSMVMTATFSSVSENRSAGEEWADYKIEPIQPISVNVILPIPEDVSLDNLDIVRGGKESPEYRFLISMYDELLGKLETEILNIDAKAAINHYLMFEPKDVDLDLDESEEINENKFYKKIRVTGKQLKILLEQRKKRKKIRITEEQLKFLLNDPE